MSEPVGIQYREAVNRGRDSPAQPPASDRSSAASDERGDPRPILMRSCGPQRLHCQLFLIGIDEFNSMLLPPSWRQIKTAKTVGAVHDRAITFISGKTRGHRRCEEIGIRRFWNTQFEFLPTPI